MHRMPTALPAFLPSCAARRPRRRSAPNLPPAVAAKAERRRHRRRTPSAFVVQRLSDGASVGLAQGADRAMQPASTLKLLTSMVALEALGPA